jgi:hypothetical protein
MIRMFPFVAVFALAGCASGPKCPEVAASQCAGQVAQVCSSERHWEDVLDCDALASQSGSKEAWVCCQVEDESGVLTHGCVPASFCAQGGAR